MTLLLAIGLLVGTAAASPCAHPHYMNQPNLALTETPVPRGTRGEGRGVLIFPWMGGYAIRLGDDSRYFKFRRAPDYAAAKSLAEAWQRAEFCRQ